MKTGNSGAVRFREHLQRARELRRKVVRTDGLTAQQKGLSAWQTNRLAATYADFAAQRRYKKALSFFLSDLYGTSDFSQRDADIERVYPIMVRVLSENALYSMSLAVELHALSQELDTTLINVLQQEFNIDVGAEPGRLNQELYAQAYRACDNYEQRVRQVDLVCETGRLLDQVVRKPVIYMTARVARGPAHAAGFGDLQDFIERGLKGFRQMRGADQFLTAVRFRETFILEQIFSGDPVSDWSAGAFQSSPPFDS